MTYSLRVLIYIERKGVIRTGPLRKFKLIIYAKIYEKNDLYHMENKIICRAHSGIFSDPRMIIYSFNILF